MRKGFAMKTIFCFVAGCLLIGQSVLAQHTSPFSQAILAKSPAVYYQMDTNPNDPIFPGTDLPDTTGNSGSLGGQGGGIKYTDANGAPVTGVTNGPNKSYFVRQTTDTPFDGSTTL